VDKALGLSSIHSGGESDQARLSIILSD